MERFDYAAENLLRHRVEAEKEEIHFMPEGEQLFWKPLKYTLGLGVLGLLLLLGAMFMSPLLKVYGNPFHPEGGQDYAGLVRMLMMLTGGMMLIIAWPIRKPRGWSIEEQEQYEDSKQWAANRRMKDDRE